MSSLTQEHCIVCLQPAKHTDYFKPNSFLYLCEYVDCPVCGKYIKRSQFNPISEIFTIMDKNNIPMRDATEEEKKQRRALLKYYLRKETSVGNDFELTSEWTHNIIQNKQLPNPIEQIDNLLLFFGNNFSLGSNISIDNLNELREEKFMSIIGCLNRDNLDFIFKSSEKQGYTYIENGYLTLSIKGWDRFDKLKRGKTDSKKAFLAMQFNSEFITKDLINKIKNSLEEVGYQLENLQDRPQAGLIDANLRQRIKNSKFLVVDLSDANNGAYWEAGYGEGLGKPVIYICDRGQFDKKVHFDTNHHLTVMYDKNCTDDKNEFHVNNFLKKLQDVIMESL